MIFKKIKKIQAQNRMGNRFLQKYIAVLLRKSEMSKKKLHTYCILEGHLHFYLDKVMVRTNLGGFWETWGGLWGGFGEPRWLKMEPRWSNMGPRWSQDGPCRSQDGCNIAILASARREKEEATQKKQQERRKKQHERSKKKEGRNNTKGKTKNLYIKTPDQPL